MSYAKWTSRKSRDEFLILPWSEGNTLYNDESPPQAKVRFLQASPKVGLFLGGSSYKRKGNSLLNPS